MNGHRLPSAVTLALLASAVAAAQAPASLGSVAPAALAARVDSLFAGVVRPDGPGCAVGAYQYGVPVLTRGYGRASVEDGRPITARTAFNLGSASKPFTALAALILEQRGALSLDDEVRRWVPELPAHSASMSVRDLIQHTSGLRDYGTLGVLSGRHAATTGQFLGLVAAQGALNFAPGARHEYSHTDFGVLAIVVERAAGIPFGEFVEAEIFAPLGMAGSFVDDGRPRGATERAFGHAGRRVRFPDGGVPGGTNAYVTVEDLARWDRNFDEATVGGPAIVARMLGRPQLAGGETIPYAYGLRLGTHGGLRTVERGGHDGGMRSEIIRFPDQRFTVAVLCNADHLAAGPLAREVAGFYLGDAMEPARPRPVAPPAVEVTAEELARYAGTYRPLEASWNLLPIEVRSGVLGEILFHGERDDTLFAMTPAGGGRFFEVGMTGNIGLYTFREEAGRLLLDISWSGGPAETLERVADSDLGRPSPEDLSAYTGAWYSGDLDAGWTLLVDGNRLVLRRTGRPDLTLRPVEADLFVRGFGSGVTEMTAMIQFHRGPGGAVTHFTVSTPPGEDSARDVRFERVEAP